MSVNFKILFILSMLFVTSHAYTQGKEKLPSIKSSSLGMGGSSSMININNKTYSVSQSIGQSSVIGTKINRNYKLLQGYQVGSITVNMVTAVENDLKATIYPNPFEESLHISFDDVIKETIIIHVFDMTGRKIIAKRYPPEQILDIQLNYIPVGIYNLIVNANKKQFVAKIIKK